MIVLGVGIFSSVLVFFFELRKTNVKRYGSNQSLSSKGRENEGRIESKFMEKALEGGGTSDDDDVGIECIEVSEEDVVSVTNSSFHPEIKEPSRSIKIQIMIG